MFVIFWSGWCRPVHPARRRVPGASTRGARWGGRWPGSSQTAARRAACAPLAYPERLGYLAAVAGHVRLHRARAGGRQRRRSRRTWPSPRSCTRPSTFVAMALYGVETWIAQRRGLQRLLRPVRAASRRWTRRDGRLGLRQPLSGLAGLEGRLPGSVLLLAVMIGTVTFDGAAEAPIWTKVAPHLVDSFESIGLSLERALELAFFVGLCGGVALVYGIYRLGVAGAASVGGGVGSRALARTFVHTLVPIATAYAMAHHFTLLALPGPVDEVPGLQPARTRRDEHLRHRRRRRSTTA
ncbi:MAG: hypothetical protein WKF40_07335 [Thermoleophilaceae bacterium]